MKFGFTAISEFIASSAARGSSSDHGVQPPQFFAGFLGGGGGRSGHGSVSPVWDRAILMLLRVVQEFRAYLCTLKRSADSSSQLNTGEEEIGLRLCLKERMKLMEQWVNREHVAPHVFRITHMVLDQMTVSRTNAGRMEGGFKH